MGLPVTDGNAPILHDVEALKKKVYGSIGDVTVMYGGRLYTAEEFESVAGKHALSKVTAQIPQATKKSGHPINVIVDSPPGNRRERRAAIAAKKREKKS